MLVSVIGDPVLFVNFTVLTGLVLPMDTVPKLKLDGEIVVCAIPEPTRSMSWGLPGASSMMFTLPSIVPPVLGANCTLMVQLPPGATLVPQVFVCMKSPLAAMLARVSAVSGSVLVSVTFFIADVVPFT